MRHSGDARADQEVLLLTRAIAQGKSEAFAAFYQVWFHRAYRLARSLTRRDESFCLDVVQDAMLKVVRSLRPIPTRERLERWIVRVVHTTALDALRREGRRLRHEQRAAVPPGVKAGSEDDSQERIEWLSARLAELPDEDRALLAERFERGKTLRASGAAVGMTGNAAHGR